MTSTANQVRDLFLQARVVQAAQDAQKMRKVRAIHPATCTCSSCVEGTAQPLNVYGHALQFSALVNETVINATGVDVRDLDSLLSSEGAERFQRFIFAEWRAGRLALDEE